MVKSDYLSESAYKKFYSLKKFTLIVIIVLTVIYSGELIAMILAPKLIDENIFFVGISLVFLKAYFISIEDFFEMQRKVKKYNLYSNLIFVQNITSIPEIADMTNSYMSNVYKELKTMIDEKLYINMSFDYETNTIVFGPFSMNKDSGQNSKDDIICKNCGGSNSKSNKVCDYCGSPLK